MGSGVFFPTSHSPFPTPYSSSLFTIITMPRLFAAHQVREAASRVEKASDHDLDRAVVDALFKTLDQITNVLNDLTHVNTGCAIAGSAGGGSLLITVLLRLND